MAYEYRSPFNSDEHHEDSADPACLIPWEEPDVRTFCEYYFAAKALLESDTKDVGQVTFALVRHLAELALKLHVYGPTQAWRPGHNLDGLREQLPDGDTLRTTDPNDVDAVQLAGFLDDLKTIDPLGDAGRYGHHMSQDECFQGWCCVEKKDLAYHARLIYLYGLEAVPALV